MLNWLKEIGVIDDEKNAKYYADLLLSRGYGPNYIKNFLKRKGFFVDLLFDKSKEAAIEKWFLKKTKGASTFDKKDWNKIFLYLKSKGFYSDDIYEFLRERGFYERE